MKLLRKIFLLTLLACCLLFSAVAQAAQVTDVKWGVNKDNVLRFVVDVTDTAGYAVDIDENNLRLTVNAKKSDKAPDRRAVKSMVADSLQVLGKGSNTVVQVPLKQKLTAKDYKAFVLKKDATTGRPFRVVLDITQPHQSAVSKSAAAGVVVSSKPVVSNRPTKVSSSAASVDAVKKQTAATEIKKKETSKKTDAKKADAKKTDSKRATAVIRADGAASTGAAAQVVTVKGSGKFRTGGGIAGKVITLDAGHGGSDPGAIGSDGTKEKNITLPITKMVKELLEAKGAKVYMTRSTDVDVYGPNASDVQELQARVNVGEKYNSDIFVSLHINSSVNKSVGGFSAYYYPKTSSDLKLAKSIQNQLTANFGVDDLGVRQANFYVIKRISMPATLLEMCFISNEKELTLMKGQWFQKKTARLIADGIEKYFA